MCAGYHLEESNALKSIAYAAEHHPIKEQILGKLGKPLVTKGDVRLSDVVPVIAPDQKKGEGRVFPMMWGFSTKLNTLIPSVDIDILDTTRNPVLLEAWSKHRCLIPSSWYYDWERIRPVDSYDTFGDQTPESERRRKYTQIKTPEKLDGSEMIGERYMLQTKGSSITLLAGLYRIEEHDGVKFPHFIILTQYAAPNIMFIHNKMPVIFDSSDAALLRDWLNPEATPPWDVDRVLENSVTEMVYEKSPVQRKRSRQPGG